MIKSILNKDDYPWYKFYGDVPHHLDYFNGSMVSYIMETAFKYPNMYAISYYNNREQYALLQALTFRFYSICLYTVSLYVCSPIVLCIYSVIIKLGVNFHDGESFG